MAPRLDRTTVAGPDDALLSPEEVERRRTFAEARNARAAKARSDRLDRLVARESAISQAVEAYKHRDKGDVPVIRLRKGFSRLQRRRQIVEPITRSKAPDRDTRADAANLRAADLHSRPPAGRLAFRGGGALPLYLTAIYMAHLTTKPGFAFKNDIRNVSFLNKDRIPPWETLAGMRGVGGALPTRRARVRRALATLAEVNLARTGEEEEHYRYATWQLLSEEGTGAHYHVPGEKTDTGLVLPATFFLYGWHLVLEPSEIVMLLAIKDQHWRHNFPADRHGAEWRKVGLPATVLNTFYGVISDEVYLAANMLYEFGLIDYEDPGLNEAKRRDETYKFSPMSDDAFDTNAFDRVRNTLSALPLPWRLMDRESLWGTRKPQEWIRLHER